MLAASTFLVPANAQMHGVIELEGRCLDAAAKARIREVTLQRDHEQHMLDGERLALANYQARLPSAERRVADDKALIEAGASAWPAGFNPQLDLNAATQAVNDLILDIQLSQEHITRLEAEIAADDQELIALSHLPPCPEPQPPQIGLTVPNNRTTPQNPSPQIGQTTPDNPQVGQNPEIPPIQIGPSPDNPDNPQIGLNNPQVPQQPVLPQPSLPLGVDKITAGPNGTTFEHHTDGSTVIRGPGGNVVGMIAPPLQQPLNQPVQPKYDPKLNVPLGEEPPKPAVVKTDAPPAPKTVGAPERKEQSVIDAFKQTGPTHTEVKPDVKADPNAKPKVGLVTPQPELKSGPLQELKPGPVTPQLKTDTKLPPVNPPKTVTGNEPKTNPHAQPTPAVRTNAVTHAAPTVTPTRFANTGPVARLAPQSSPAMRVNNFHPAFSPAAPRPGGFAMGGLRRSRDIQPPPAAQQTEEKQVEPAK